MRRMGVFVVVVSVLALLALPALAQQMAGNVTRVFWLRAKAGMEKQFAEGRKKHMDWHRQQNDTWTWHVWWVETGEDAGQTVAVTPGHRWEEFDARAEFDKADVADFELNVAPYTGELGSAFYLYRPEFSRPYPGGNPPPMISVIHFHLNIGMADEAEYAIKKFHEAIAKTNWPTKGYEWYTLLNGGRGPRFVLVLAREKWADMAPPEKPFDKMVEEAYGRKEADALLDQWNKCLRMVESEQLRYSADLSYVPATK